MPGNVIDVGHLFNETNGTNLDIQKCGKHCTYPDYNRTMYVVMKDDLCFCGEKDLFNDGFISDIRYDKCNKCNTECPQTESQRLGKQNYCPGYYSPYTCGSPDKLGKDEQMYSVYCNDPLKCQIFNTELKESEAYQFTYFACTKRPQTFPVSCESHFTSNAAECLNLCQENLSVYMKPHNDTHLECICKMIPNITINDLGMGCDLTWSRGMPGPIGDKSVK